MDIPKVIAFGQAGVDFVGCESNTSLKDMSTFKKSAGGAPANVAAGLGKLGIPVMFVGKVGDDHFGHFIGEALKKCKVDISQLKFATGVQTMIAFESTLKTPELIFYGGKTGPQSLFTKGEIPIKYFKIGTTFLFSSMTLIQDPSRKATLEAVNLASKNGLFIAFDPNLRLSVWSNMREAKYIVRKALNKASCVKLSLNEFNLLSEDAEFDQFRSRYNIDLLAITAGAEGSFYCTEKYTGFVKGEKVKVRDTTGAGDGFFAALLYQIINLGADNSAKLKSLTKKELVKITRFANFVGAITVTELGAISALPTLKKINNFLKSPWKS